jgi:Micrococcal nuclease (thermonuclease) homologs
MRETDLLSTARWPGALALGAVMISFAMAPKASAVSWFGMSDLTGTATVIDGNTIDLKGQRIRLGGIDAPEMAQVCGMATGGSWACGREAANALVKLTGNRQVVCLSHGTDKYDRVLGVCSVDGVEINAELVRQGLAWAFVKYSTSYVKQETEAKAAAVGVWQGDAQPAWIYRENRWKTAEGDAPAGCAIKGNITENGHIYHMPWSPWYGRVKIEPNRGERWFCSEDEAKSASWRSAALR